MKIAERLYFLTLSIVAMFSLITDVIIAIFDPEMITMRTLLLAVICVGIILYVQNHFYRYDTTKKE